MLHPNWATLHPNWATLHPNWDTLHPNWATLQPNWPTLQPNWATLHPNWTTLHPLKGAAFVIFTLSGFQQLIAKTHLIQPFCQLTRVNVAYIQLINFFFWWWLYLYRCTQYSRGVPSFTYLVSWTVRGRLWERVHNCLFYKLNTTKILPQRPVPSRRLWLSAVTL